MSSTGTRQLDVFGAELKRRGFQTTMMVITILTRLLQKSRGRNRFGDHSPPISPTAPFIIAGHMFSVMIVPTAATAAAVVVIVL